MCARSSVARGIDAARRRSGSRGQTVGFRNGRGDGIECQFVGARNNAWVPAALTIQMRGRYRSACVVQCSAAPDHPSIMRPYFVSWWMNKRRRQAVTPSRNAERRFFPRACRRSTDRLSLVGLCAGLVAFSRRGSTRLARAVNSTSWMRSPPSLGRTAVVWRWLSGERSPARLHGVLNSA